MHFNQIYFLAVLVIALYGHAGLCYMTCEAQPIMAHPLWPSKIHNGLVNPVKAWLTQESRLGLEAN